MSFPIYNAPEPFTDTVSWLDYNLEQNTYNWQAFFGSPFNGKFIATESIPSTGRFSPEVVAGTGIR